jgi:hypothetical protein
VINFNLFASASLYAKEANMDISLSKQEIENIVLDPLSYFKDYTLTKEQEKELKELFEKTLIIDILKQRLENDEYQEFNKKDEEKALENFHNDIKAFNKKYNLD